LAVQRTALREHDEELRVRGIRVGRPRHAHRAAAEGLARELGGHVGQVRSTSPVALRIAGLSHEAVDHAVEDEPVVEAALSQRLDPLRVLGGDVGPKADRHPPVLGLEKDRVLRIGGRLRGSRTGERQAEGRGGEAQCTAG
jgi:hypothetical protein